MHYCRSLCLILFSFLFTFSSFATPTGSLKRVAYFAEWGVYAREYEMADVPAERLTHLLYAFAVIDPATYECKVYDNWAALQTGFEPRNGFSAQAMDDQTNQSGNFARIKALKARYPHLKVLLSVGGATKSSEFSKAVTDELFVPHHEGEISIQKREDEDQGFDSQEAMTYRSHLVKSCVALMNQYGFDGLDYDWQYPVAGGLEANDHRPEDKKNFTALLRETRAALAPGKELTVAVTSDPVLMENLEVDAMHVMSYDYHGGWNNFTGHVAPLYPASASRFELDADRLARNVDATIRAYIERGAHPAKLVLGVPFYGRAWITSAHNAQHGLYRSAIEQEAPKPLLAVPGNWEDGQFDTWKIMQLLAEGQLEAYYDGVSHAPYAYSAEMGLFISYDDAASLKEKIEYVHAHHLGGMMMWELSGDIKESKDSLLRVIDENLQ
jgi:chitinase